MRRFYNVQSATTSPNKRSILLSSRLSSCKTVEDKLRINTHITNLRNINVPDPCKGASLALTSYVSRYCFCRVQTVLPTFRYQQESRHLLSDRMWQSAHVFTLYTRTCCFSRSHRTAPSLLDKLAKIRQKRSAFNYPYLEFIGRQDEFIPNTIPAFLAFVVNSEADKQLISLSNWRRGWVVNFYLRHQGARSGWPGGCTKGD